MFFHRLFGSKWVDRGDPDEHDFTIGYFTLDAQWHDLDLSSIIGKSRKLVLIHGHIQENTSGEEFQFRTKGNLYDRNVAICYTQVADKLCAHNFWVTTDENGVVQYFADTAGWGTVTMDVRGWFVM